MNRGRFLWIVSGLAAVAIVAPLAQSSTAPKDPRVPGLAKKVTSLQKTVSNLQSAIATLHGKEGTLEARATALEADKACRQSVLGVAQFGAPSQGEGYLYGRGSDLFLVTALDVATK